MPVRLLRHQKRQGKQCQDKSNDEAAIIVGLYDLPATIAASDAAAAKCHHRAERDWRSAARADGMRACEHERQHGEGRAQDVAKASSRQAVRRAL